MKKILSLVLILTMVLGSIGFTFAAGANGEYDRLFNHGILIGDGSGNLMLDQTLSREQYAVFATRLLGFSDAEVRALNEKSPFEDVKGDYAPFIGKAYKEGLVAGRSATKFDPKADVSYVEALTILMRALGYNNDLKGLAWPSGFFAKATELGLVDATIAMDAKITRRQMADTILVALDTNTKAGVRLAVALGLEVDLAVVSHEVVDSKTVKVTFNDGAVVEYTLDPALVANKETTITVEHEGKEFEIVVKWVVTKLEVVSVSATNLREVEVVFTTPIDREKLDKANFLLGTTEATRVTLLPDGVTVRACFVMENQTRYTLNIKSVVDIAGNEIKDFSQQFTANDFTPPTVVGVEVQGNRRLIVTFSEPVNPAQALILSNYQINDRLFGAAITLTPNNRQARLLLSNPLADGVHKLTVSSNVQDFAAFRMMPNSTEFAVAKDETKPAVASINEATQTKVVLTFTKPVDENFTVVPAAGALFVDKTTTDNITWTLNFSASNPLPLSGTEITLRDVTDFFGNKDTIRINVVPVIDLVRPEVKSVRAIAQDKLLVEFTKNVRLDHGTYTLKTVAENPVTRPVTLAHFINTDVTPNATVQSKVVLTAASGTFAAGEYTLEIIGVVDNTPLRNQVVPAVINVTVPDLTAPTVTRVIKDEPTVDRAGALYVEFSERVDVATATNLANFSYIVNNVRPVSLGSAHTVTLLADGRTVKITVPRLAASDAGATITSLTTVNVTDLAGNKVPATVTTSFTPFAGVQGVPTVANARMTSRNTLVIDVPKNINPNTVTASDFLVRAATTPDTTPIFVINAVHNVTDSVYNTITLTLNNNVSPIARFNNANLTLEVIARNLQNIFGERIELATGIPVIDRIAPTATRLASATWGANTLTMVVELSEDLATHTQTPEAFVIVVNGVLYTANSIVHTPAVADPAAPARLTITVNTGATSFVGRSLRVNFFSHDNYRDAAGNNLQNFEFSATVTAAAE